MRLAKGQMVIGVASNLDYKDIVHNARLNFSLRKSWGKMKQNIVDLPRKGKINSLVTFAPVLIMVRLIQVQGNILVKHAGLKEITTL